MIALAVGDGGSEVVVSSQTSILAQETMAGGARGTLVVCGTIPNFSFLPPDYAVSRANCHTFGGENTLYPPLFQLLCGVLLCVLASGGCATVTIPLCHVPPRTRPLVLGLSRR